VINRVEQYDTPLPSETGGGGVTPAPDSLQVATVGCLLVFFLLMVVAVAGRVIIKVAEIIWGGG
jgi:hypothetical protein